MAENGRQKLRWFQFSLGGLLLFVTLCAVLCAWWRDHQQLKKRIERGTAIIEMLREGPEVARLGIEAPLAEKSCPYESVEQFLAALKNAQSGPQCQDIIACVRSNEIGQDAVPALLSMLKDPSAEMRKRAASAIGQIRAFNEAVVPELIKRLNAPDDVVRYGMMRALRKCGSEAEAAVPLLRKALENPVDRCRVAAAETLWSINRDSRAVDVLIEVLQDEKSVHRISAVDALGKIGPKDTARAVPALREACRAKDNELRMIALGTLMNYLPPTEMVELLLEADKDANPNLHQEISILFRRLDREHPGQIFPSE